MPCVDRGSSAAGVSVCLSRGSDPLGSWLTRMSVFFLALSLFPVALQQMKHTCGNVAIGAAVNSYLHPIEMKANLSPSPLTARPAA